MWWYAASQSAGMPVGSVKSRWLIWSASSGRSFRNFSSSWASAAQSPRIWAASGQSARDSRRPGQATTVTTRHALPHQSNDRHAMPEGFGDRIDAVVGRGVQADVDSERYSSALRRLLVPSSSRKRLGSMPKRRKRWRTNFRTLGAFSCMLQMSITAPGRDEGPRPETDHSVLSFAPIPKQPKVTKQFLSSQGGNRQGLFKVVVVAKEAARRR